MAQAVADKRAAEAAAVRAAEQAKRDREARVIEEERRMEAAKREAERLEIKAQQAAFDAEQDAAARAAWAAEMVARAAAAAAASESKQAKPAPVHIFTRIRPGVLNPILGATSSLANNRRAAALVNAQSIVVPRNQLPARGKAALMAKSASVGALEKERSGSGGKRSKHRSPPSPVPDLFANRAPFDHSSPYTGALRPGFLLQPLPAPPQFGQASVTLEATLARQGATGYVVAASMSSSMAGKQGSSHSPTRAPNGVETAPAASPAGANAPGGPGANSESTLPVIPPFVFESRELLMGSPVERAARLAEIQRAREEAKDGETVSGASMWDDIPTDRDRKKQAERVAAAAAAQRKDATPLRGLGHAPSHSQGRDHKSTSPHRRPGSVAPMDQIAAVHAATLETIVGAAREAQAIAVMQAQAEAEAKALQRHLEREARHARTRSTYINTKELRSRHAHARSNSSLRDQNQHSPSSKGTPPQMFRTQVFVTPPPEQDDSPVPGARATTMAWPQNGSAEEEKQQDSPNSQQKKRPVATRLDFSGGGAPEAVPTIESVLTGATNQPAATTEATADVVVGSEVAESGRIRSRRGSLEGSSGAGSVPLEVESQSQLIITHDRPVSAASRATKERRPSRVGAAVVVAGSHHDDHTVAASSEGATSPSAEGGSSELYHLDTPRGGRRVAAVSPEADVRAMTDAAAGASGSKSGSGGKKKNMAWGQDESASNGSAHKSASARSTTSPLAALPERTSGSTPSTQPRVSTMHPRFQRVSRAHPTAGCFPPVPIALPIADPAAGPTMSEYLRSLALVSKPSKPSQAVVSTIVPLPQEFARIKGAGLLTLGSAVAYGSTLTPEVLAAKRRKKVRRDRERRAAIAWFEEKYIAEQERRKQWQQGDVHQSQEQSAERAAEDENRRRIIEAERAARDAQREVERALYAARLEPLLSLCALFLSPASRLLEHAPAIYLSRVWDQKEHCTWFPLLFQWAEHDLGRNQADIIDLLTLLVQSQSDKAESFLLPFFDRSYERVRALPPRTRVQLAAKFVATWGKGPFTAAGEPEPWALPGHTVPTPLTPRSRERMELMLASAEAKLSQRRKLSRPAADSAARSGAAGNDEDGYEGESAAARAVRKEKAAAEKARIKAERTAALKSALAAEREAAYAAMVAEREAAYGISPASKATRLSKRRSTGLGSGFEGVPGPRRAEDEKLDAEVAEKVALIAAEMAKRHADAQAKLAMVRAPDHASKHKLALIQGPGQLLNPADAAVQFGAPKPKPKPTSAAARNAEEFAAEALAAKAASDERAARIAAAKKAEAEAKRAAKLEAAAAVAAQVALEKKQFAAALEKKRAEEAAAAEAAAIRKAEREAAAAAARQKAEEEAMAAAAKRRQLKEDRARAKQQREEEAAAAAALRREEQAAAAAAAQLRADTEAAEAAARRAAREEAAAEKKRVEDEIAARKRDEIAAAAALAKAKRDAEAAAAAKQLADSIAAAEAAVALSKLSKEEQAKHKAAAAAAKEQAAEAAAKEAAAKRIADHRAAEAEAEEKKKADAAAKAEADRLAKEAAAAAVSAKEAATVAAQQKADQDAAATAAQPKANADAAAKPKADSDVAASVPAATKPAPVSAPAPIPPVAPAPASVGPAVPADGFPAGAVLRAQIQALMESERFAEALPLAEQEIEEREAFHAQTSSGARGPSDPALLPSLDNCATLHEILGSPAAALPYLFQALQCEKAKAGTMMHLAVAAALQRLGESLMALQEGEDAFNVFARAYLIRKTLLGPNHALTIKAREGVMHLTEPNFQIDELSLQEIPPLAGEEGEEQAEQHEEADAAAAAPVSTVKPPNSREKSAAAAAAASDDLPLDVDALRKQQKAQKR